MGFASPRADEGRSRDPYRQANASFSLLQRREGKVVRHTLIDVGMGVVPSLRELERPEDPIHGPMDLARYRRELRRAAPDLDVQPAVHGMVLGDDTPWPES